MAQGVVDDLTQQVEQLEGIYIMLVSSHNTIGSLSLCVCVCAMCVGQLDGLKKEVGKLKGEKAALQRETARLRAQVYTTCTPSHITHTTSIPHTTQSDGEKDRLAQTLAELATKTDQLEAAW